MNLRSRTQSPQLLWCNLSISGLRLLGLSVAGLFLLNPCWAEVPPVDTVELSLGSHLTGKVIKKHADWVVMQLDEELAVAIPQQRVRRLRESSELTEYKSKAANAANDPEANYQLARWCKDNSLSHQYKYHLHRVIALSPDHAKARSALGYVKQTGGEWILYSLQQRGKGLVLTKSGWDFPEVVAKRELRDEAKVTANKYRKELARAVTPYLKANNDRAAGFLNTIRGFTDPIAAGAVAEQLERSRGKKVSAREADLRMEFITLLGKHRNYTSIEALVKTGLEEPSALIREAAIAELQKHGSSSAIATCLPMLRSSNPRVVDQALRMLRFFPDRAHVMAYIGALITTHKTEIAAGAGTSAGFGNDGSGSFSAGGKKTVIVKNIRHPDALALLKEVEPGADYSYDEQAWRKHFAAQWNYYTGNLRRDP